MKQVMVAISIIVFAITLIAVSFTFNQVNDESLRLENDIEYRSALLANSLKETVEPNFNNKSDDYLQDVVNRFSDQQRIAGLAIFDSTGKITAVSSSLSNELPMLEAPIDVMDENKAGGEFIDLNGKRNYAYAIPLRNDKSVVGALMIVQNASYIDNRIMDIWQNSLLRLLVQVLITTAAVFLILRWTIFKPLRNLVETLQSTRRGGIGKNSNKVFSNPFFTPLFKEVRNMQQNLIEARIAANEEARKQLKKLDSPWTAERLKVFVNDILKDRKIFVVSNREPYIHSKKGNNITFQFPASGMATAIEPMMQACGGTWIAHGSGNADQEVVNSNNEIAVPPNEPKYTLKRIFLTEKEEKGYYLGFSNQGIWPLCHMTHTRPVFRKDDWEMYKKVNEKFAISVLREIKKEKNPIVFIQDFHLALVPQLIKKRKPSATIGMFWHIPWPNAESFSICPWRKELIEGMLGADILGFHTQLHCNNFITTVGREVESLIDRELFAVTKNDHTTFIKPFPISISFTNSTNRSKSIETDLPDAKKLLHDLGIKTKYLGIGVDRLDYTKGILERLKAIEIFLTNYPTFIGKFTFLQISAPSRESIKEYQDFLKNVTDEVNRINDSFKNKGWKPIIFVNEHYDHQKIDALFRVSNFCFVSSLHDGMNLVAKEFVAARQDEKGVLILSQFTGASRELNDALIVNPYNGESTAQSIYEALKMDSSEQRKRMRRMRSTIKNHNVYHWSAEFLKTMVDLE